VENKLCLIWSFFSEIEGVSFFKLKFHIACPNAMKQSPCTLLNIEFSICIKNATSHIATKPLHSFAHKNIKFQSFYKLKKYFSFYFDYGKLHRTH